MDIQKLIDEIVVKLKELYAALGTERAKVGQAIAVLTGTPVDEGGTLTPEEIAALKAELQQLKTKLGQVGR